NYFQSSLKRFCRARRVFGRGATAIAQRDPELSISNRPSFSRRFRLVEEIAQGSTLFRVLREAVRTFLCQNSAQVLLAVLSMLVAIWIAGSNFVQLNLRMAPSAR